ncbi:MAG: 2-dehydropantoate 2-reductase, partial [Verrucomicrobiota bacterium]
ITIGEYQRTLQPRTQRLADEFNRCRIECRAVDDLMTARWHKLVWNIPFNGLSIVGGCLDTERILADESLSALVKSLMEEVIAAAGWLGHELPASLADEMIRQTRSIKPYKTSSLIDFMENREVELESIWGEPCRLAGNAGASIGRMEMLYQLLRHQVAMRDAASP